MLHYSRFTSKRKYVCLVFSRESDSTITNVCSFVRPSVRLFVCKTPNTARIQSFDLTTILTTMLTIFLVTLTIILTPILHQHHYPNNRSTGTTILTLFHLPPSPSSPHIYLFNKSTGTTILTLSTILQPFFNQPPTLSLTLM